MRYLDSSLKMILRFVKIAAQGRRSQCQYRSIISMRGTVRRLTVNLEVVFKKRFRMRHFGQ